MRDSFIASYANIIILSIFAQHLRQKKFYSIRFNVVLSRHSIKLSELQIKQAYQIYQLS